MVSWNSDSVDINSILDTFGFTIKSFPYSVIISVKFGSAHRIQNLYIQHRHTKHSLSISIKSSLLISEITRFHIVPVFIGYGSLLYCSQIEESRCNELFHRMIAQDVQQFYKDVTFRTYQQEEKCEYYNDKIRQFKIYRADLEVSHQLEILRNTQTEI